MASLNNWRSPVVGKDCEIFILLELFSPSSSQCVSKSDKGVLCHMWIMPTPPTKIRQQVDFYLGPRHLCFYPVRISWSESAKKWETEKWAPFRGENGNPKPHGAPSLQDPQQGSASLFPYKNFSDRVEFAQIHICPVFWLCRYMSQVQSVFGQGVHNLKNIIFDFIKISIRIKMTWNSPAIKGPKSSGTTFH